MAENGTPRRGTGDRLLEMAGHITGQLDDVKERLNVSESTNRRLRKATWVLGVVTYLVLVLGAGGVAQAYQNCKANNDTRAGMAGMLRYFRDLGRAGPPGERRDASEAALTRALDFVPPVDCSAGTIGIKLAVVASGAALAIIGLGLLAMLVLPCGRRMFRRGLARIRRTPVY